MIMDPHKALRNQRTCVNNKVARNVKNPALRRDISLPVTFSSAPATFSKLVQQSIVHVNLTYNQSLKLTIIHSYLYASRDVLLHRKPAGRCSF
jgi:hypothetical protein